MKLIVNADDFGLSEAVNYGIIKAYTDGVVRSTTLMATMPGFNHALELSKEYDIGVGIHLTLTSGAALTGSHKTITDSNGMFFRQGEFFERAKSGRIDGTELESELRAQIEKSLKAGFKLTHFDSHHHFHLVKGVVFDTVLKLANEYKLPLRAGKKDEFAKDYNNVRSSDRFSMDFYGKDISSDTFISIADKYKNTNESLEIMVHPAYLDKIVMDLSSYNIPRTAELDILTSSKIKDYVKNNKIELINFRDIAPL